MGIYLLFCGMWIISSQDLIRAIQQGIIWVHKGKFCNLNLLRSSLHLKHSSSTLPSLHDKWDVGEMLQNTSNHSSLTCASIHFIFQQHDKLFKKKFAGLNKSQELTPKWQEQKLMLVSHGSAFATCARKAFATLEDQNFCLFDRFCLRGCCFFSFKHPSLFLTLFSVPVRRFHRSTPPRVPHYFPGNCNMHFTRKWT